MSGSIGVPPEKIEEAKKKLETLKKECGYVEPDRGNLDDPEIQWREGKPNYAAANLSYFLGKSRSSTNERFLAFLNFLGTHKSGSLEEIVQNLVKTWEMEASHKPNISQWTTVNPELYQIQANGGKIFKGEKALAAGNYNCLMHGCPKHLYDAEKETFESSHQHFRGAFPNGFPWEVLEVYSGPPKVAFSWRHWATFDGGYKGNKGDGRLVEMYGFCVVQVDENLKIGPIEVYYKPNEFLEKLEGKTQATASQEDAIKKVTSS